MLGTLMLDGAFGPCDVACLVTHFVILLSPIVLGPFVILFGSAASAWSSFFFLLSFFFEIIFFFLSSLGRWNWGFIFLGKEV